MSKIPYPGYPPNYTKVDKLCGRHRHCWVLEMLTDKKLTPLEEALILEKMEAIISNQLNERNGVAGFEIISQDRFDTQLLKGLRL